MAKLWDHHKKLKIYIELTVYSSINKTTSNFGLKNILKIIIVINYKNFNLNINNKI